MCEYLVLFNECNTASLNIEGKISRQIRQGDMDWRK